MDIFSTVNNSISLVQRLRTISKNIEHAEFRNLIAELSRELADIKLEAANLKEQVAALEDENRVLKQKAPESHDKPVGTKWGCYQFEGDDGLYCTACWDSKRQKSRTNRVTSKWRRCPVCRATIGA